MKVVYIIWLYHSCPPVRKIINSLKLVDYLHVQADNPWYSLYISYCRATEAQASLVTVSNKFWYRELVLAFISPHFP